MKKWTQALSLVLAFAIAAAARLSILGWLFIIGVGLPKVSFGLFFGF
jgi:hypothetical protein